MPNRRPRTIPSRQPWLSPFRKSGRHDDCRSLYWRSEARLPIGLASRPTCRGTCPPQVLEAQGAQGRSRLAGPYREVYRIDELTDDMKGAGGRREESAGFRHARRVSIPTSQGVVVADGGFERGLQPKEAVLQGARIALVERDRATAFGKKQP